jgi:hypothetical protein
MENSPASKHTVSFGVSLALCTLLNAGLVIAKEKSKSVADWMQKVTGHHWVTHVLIVLVLFTACGWCFSRTNGRQGPRMSLACLTNTIFSGVIAGVFIVLGLYLIAD